MNTPTLLFFTLTVRNGAQAAAFYERAFGAVELHRAESPDGDVVAELAITAGAQKV